MPTNSMGYIRARDAVAHLLDELGLTTYLYEVEYSEQGWLLRVECGGENREWLSTSLCIAETELLDSLTNPSAAARVRTQLAERLGYCQPN